MHTNLLVKNRTLNYVTWLIILFVYFYNLLTDTDQLMIRASYWKHLTYFKQSVISGLIWYIQVSLVHSGHLPDNISLELVKVHHPLMPSIYSEAERLFKIFYRNNFSSEIVVRDCAEYPQLNDSRG